MATVNLKEVMEAVQKKIYAADSSTSNLQDLIYLLKSAKRGDGTMVQQVASASVLPDLTDSAADTEMIAFVQNEGKLYFKQDSSGTTVWKTYTPASPGPTHAQGSTSGYTSGGFIVPPNVQNVIQKFPFTSDGNATDVGDLTQGRYYVSGQSSSTHGYTSGGVSAEGPAPYPPWEKNIIDRFSFSSDGNATDVGDLTLIKRSTAGQSSTTSGYVSGGYTPTAAPTGTINVIEKFPFSSNSNASDVGDLTGARGNVIGQSSADNGYASGGDIPPSTNIIDKFPFSSDGNATDVGDLTVARQNGAGQNSSSNGYYSGGQTTTDIIDKFPFSSDANATDVGDLTVARRMMSGQSSTVSGYTAGGVDAVSTPSYVNVIDKFPFSSDGNATDVGDLVGNTAITAGQQV